MPETGAFTDGRSDPARAAAATDEGSVHLSVLEDRVRLTLSGAVDVASTKDLTRAAEEALDTGLPVEVDTRAVTFIDSSTVATLAWLASRTTGQLRMIDPPDVVTFVLEVTRVGDVVDVVHENGAEPTA